MGSEIHYGDLNFALVKNVGERRTVVTYNSVPFIIEPGDIEPVAFEAVCNACGDPRSDDVPQITKVQGGETRYIPARYEERKRLRNLYGMMDGGEDEIVMLAHVPQLEVKYRGQRVYTVIEDPYGAKTKPADTVSPVQRNMQEQVDFLEDQLKVLNSRFASGSSSPSDPDFTMYHEDELPADVAPDPGVPPLPRPTTENLDWATAQTSTTPFDE